MVERTWNLTVPPLTVLAPLLASSNESHLKVVKKMSRCCQKLFKNLSSGNGMARSTVISHLISELNVVSCFFIILSVLG